jgi:hypothetical protein
MLLVLSTHQAGAQDLGEVLEQAARDKLRDSLDPQRLEPSIAPGRPNPNATPQPGANPAAAAPRGEVVPIKTADGWTLVAHHYRPTARPVAGAPPVILCHGLTYNAQFWDLDPSCSPAEYLAAAGFDVWAVSLRGCGLSQK